MRETNLNAKFIELDDTLVFRSTDINSIDDFNIFNCQIFTYRVFFRLAAKN